MLEVTNPANPFDDIYAEAVSVSPDLHNDYAGKILAFPDTVTVPFIAALPPGHSPESIISASTSPSIAPAGHQAIEWTAADLNYLLSALYPDEMVANSIMFVPDLEALPAAGSPVRLQMFLRIPAAPVPREAYSANAPIGTGRPVGKVLAGDSGLCVDVRTARRALAEDLLADRYAIQHAIGYYSLLRVFYSLSEASLRSVKHGIVGMARSGELEWYERLSQLQDARIDSSWPLEAKLEVMLLEGGRWGLGGWLGVVELGLGLTPEVRKSWAGVYAEANDFLKAALETMWREAAG